ncbi:MAG TPA: hypothetical protein VFQ07_01875, partial [Candidatus Polarisedimenticolia bacterium]|nr:hypothetical protein [Candidatus Polarisedimenticolia bacterium]
MKIAKPWLVALCGIALCAAAGVSMAGDRHHGDAILPNILTFDSMYGVDGPFLGEANAIRGVVGDEAPWTIDHFIRGRLTKGGRLQIVVRGLVFGDDPELVPPELIGKNDEETFRGLVSCLTEEGETVVTKNVMTDGFPADMNGNSFIDAKIDLPNPCVAPIVFVMAGSEDKWFAVTGFEREEEGEDATSGR